MEHFMMKKFGTVQKLEGKLIEDILRRIEVGLCVFNFSNRVTIMGSDFKDKKKSGSFFIQYQNLSSIQQLVMEIVLFSNEPFQ